MPASVRPKTEAEERARFEKHRRTRARKPPSELFKYASAESVLAILQSHRVFFSSPLLFNDPFDTQWDVIWPAFTEEAIAERDQDFVRALTSEAQLGSPADPELVDAIVAERAKLATMQHAERHARIDELRRQNQIQGTFRKLMDEILADFTSRLRICSLSELADDPLMWAHYSDCHKGIVIGFDTDRFEVGVGRPVDAVKYWASAPEIEEVRTLARGLLWGKPVQVSFEQLMRGMVYAKLEDWNYEKEWRFAFLAPPNTSGLKDPIPIPPGTITSITRGLRCDRSRWQQAVAMARQINPNVVVYQMRLGTHKFRLAREQCDLRVPLSGINDTIADSYTDYPRAPGASQSGPPFEGAIE